MKIPPGRYPSPPRVSPDGKQIAFGTDDGKEAIVYTYELSGTSPMQRATYGGNNRFPIWSPDGRLVYQSDREGDTAIWRAAPGGVPERLTRAGKGEIHAPESWHPKANVLLFSITKGTDVSLWTISPPDTNAARFGDVHSIYTTGARFSPDGRWVAYTVRDRIGSSIFVRSFPASANKHQLPVKGANANPHKPAWSSDGTKLFYVPRILEFEVVPIATTPTVVFGNAETVPRPFGPGGPNVRTLFDIAPDGRFIGLVAAGESSLFSGSVSPERRELAIRAASRIRVVLNWFEELQAQVPLPRK